MSAMHVSRMNWSDLGRVWSQCQGGLRDYVYDSAPVSLLESDTVQSRWLRGILQACEACEIDTVSKVGGLNFLNNPRVPEAVWRGRFDYGTRRSDVRESCKISDGTHDPRSVEHQAEALLHIVTFRQDSGVVITLDS